MKRDIEDRLKELLTTDEDPQDARPNTFTLYSRTKSLKKSTDGKRLLGCFAHSFSEACFAISPSYVQIAAIVKMDALGKCSGGDEVTMIELH